MDTNDINFLFINCDILYWFCQLTEESIYYLKVFVVLSKLENLII